MTQDQKLDKILANQKGITSMIVCLLGVVTALDSADEEVAKQIAESLLNMATKIMED